MDYHFIIDCIIAFCLPYLVVSEIITYIQNEMWKKKIERLLDKQKK